MSVRRRNFSGTLRPLVAGALLGCALVVSMAAPSAAEPNSIPATSPNDSESAQHADSATAPYDPRMETTGYGPYATNYLSGFVHGVGSPDSAPQGSNDWNCTPSALHPRPVVLLHGTWSNAYSIFARISPELKKENYCVFALNYGDHDPSVIGNVKALRGTDAIPESTKEIATYVDAVLAATGATQVDLVGHSQGALQIRQYLRFEGGADASDPTRNKVANAVSISGSNHGTTLLGLETLARTVDDLGLDVDGAAGVVWGRAAADQVVGSTVVDDLDAGGDTDPGVAYTAIISKYDQVVTPYQSSFLTAGPNATVANVTLQDGCPIDLSDHLSITMSERAIGIVKNALDPQGFPSTRIPCTFNAPVTGG